MEAQATRSCRVSAQGVVADCRILSETPDAYGFGEAALKLTRYFRMTPRPSAAVPSTARTSRSRSVSPSSDPGRHQ